VSRQARGDALVGKETRESSRETLGQRTAHVDRQQVQLRVQGTHEAAAQADECRDDQVAKVECSP